MKLRSLLSTCSATICTATDDTTTINQPHKSKQPTPNRFFSDTSSIMSDITTSPSIDTSYNSLHSNLSIQTLPSVPSLQKLSPETLNLAVSHGYIDSLKPSPAGHVNFLAVNNNLLYAATGKLIHVYDTTSFTLMDTFNVKDSASGTVKSVTFHNGTIFTSHQDTKIRVWKLKENKHKLSAMDGPSRNSRHKQVGTLPTLEDRLLRSVFKKNYVNVRRHRRRLWIEHHDAVSGLAKIDDELMCSISWDKYLKIWKTSSLRCVESIKAHDDAINAVVVAVDGTIYTGSADRRIKVWGKPKPIVETETETETKTKTKYVLIATLEKHKSAVNALALNEVGSVLFSGACDRSILVWEKEDSANHMAVTGALRGHSKAILCLINVSDLLFSGSADRTVRIWQRGVAGKFCCLAVLDGHKQPVRSLVADIQNIRLITGGTGCVSNNMAVLNGHKQPVRTLDANSDSKITESKSETAIQVFSGSFEGEIKIWKVEVLKFNSPMSTPLIKMKL